MADDGEAVVIMTASNPVLRFGHKPIEHVIPTALGRYRKGGDGACSAIAEGFSDIALLLRRDGMGNARRER
ncbi:hypothetical protein [Rhizobium mongolense]|uniref:Uncharacterized protein n=1 Tax=Rhizobium mongolense TaxID=57676 RepID=A0ABR6ILL5_9HYPH|nr:hypothetical protein [Rhizobium mongolense]MBB4228762.1 hypothetical protein [Rhizobium mongolense]